MKQATSRLNWVDIQLPLRPHSKNWLDIAFCDEFHLGIALKPQSVRSVGVEKQSERSPWNVHKVISKDTKAKAREEQPLKLLSVFVTVGYNYRRVITYEVPNNVGKMTTKCYLNYILPTINDEL
ncbi:hypothetical protein BKA61DRAFT_575408 [Leptodontidium sp. MPI-SDFR-AT-0119]|nr:hypothetical protein BKA61DRAFT_575408 [Leptodontidium sp. MPI-SDFR-AT-0119]